VTLLDDILSPAAITTLFQPIVAFDASGVRTLHGYEALTRGPRGTHASRADVLFEYVRRKRAEPQVDRACVVAALQAARSLPVCPTLSLNVHAATLGQDDHFADLLTDTAARHGFAPEQLVVEIVEQSSVWNTTGFNRMLAALREAGIRIAIDDVGTGHSNLQMLVEVRPDFLKLDRFFVSGAATDPVRQAVLRSMAALADAIGCEVVAEGVETLDELAVVLASGITLAQGFLLSPPLSATSPFPFTTARPSVAPIPA
jgi:EAL domain-containing protein (putative c-di-GMP-specific phosphodiesterase class I)